MEIKKEQLRGEIGAIQEMSSEDNFSLDIPITGVDMEALKANDKDPLFVTVEVLNPQTSKNGNNWTIEAMRSVMEQINKFKPDAYLGHMKDEDRPYKAPESQTIWLGAVIKEIAGKPRLFAKGYILPYAEKLKQYLKIAKSTGKDVGVSVYGLAEKVRGAIRGTWDIKSFNLESIDWARSGSKGTKDTNFLLLTSEMSDKQEVKMDKAEIISEMSRKDLEKYNSELFTEVKTLGEQDASEKIQKTLEEKETELKKATDIISEMSKQASDLIGSYVDNELAKKIANEATRGFISKMVMSEMTGKASTKAVADEALKTVLESDATKALLKEMIDDKKFAPENKGQEQAKKEVGIKY